VAGERSGASRHKPSPGEQRARRAAVDDPAVVLEAGLRFLEARSRSVAEVRRRLTRAGYREELVRAAIERLEELGVLDDEAFAAQWVESRDRAHPRGEHALMQELRQKGIAAPIVAATLRRRRDAATRWDATGTTEGDSGPDGGPPPSADEAAAERLLARHARALARVTDLRARRQRAYALLARNGFDPSAAADAARRFVDAERDGDTDGPRAGFESP
jgi:SOS response regulatory protein OraA/RecX